MQLIPKSSARLPASVGTVSWVQPAAALHESTIGWFPFAPPVPAAMQKDTPTQDTDCRMTSLKLFVTVLGVQVVPSHEAA